MQSSSGRMRWKSPQSCLARCLQRKISFPLFSFLFFFFFKWGATKRQDQRRGSDRHQHCGDNVCEVPNDAMMILNGLPVFYVPPFCWRGISCECLEKLVSLHSVACSAVMTHKRGECRASFCFDTKTFQQVHVAWWLFAKLKLSFCSHWKRQK